MTCLQWWQRIRLYKHVHNKESYEQNIRRIQMWMNIRKQRGAEDACIIYVIGMCRPRRRQNMLCLSEHTSFIMCRTASKVISPFRLISLATMSSSRGRMLVLLFNPSPTLSFTLYHRLNKYYKCKRVRNCTQTLLSIDPPYSKTAR